MLTTRSHLDLWEKGQVEILKSALWVNASLRPVFRVKSLEELYDMVFNICVAGAKRG